MIFQCHGGNTVAAGLDNPAYEQEEVKQESSAVLPWKREDQEVQVTSMADQQMPAWIRNQDHISSYSSPSNTLLGLPRDEKKRSAIIGYFQKRDSLTFLGDFENVDSKNGSRRNSKDGDFLSVLANPVNIRKSSAPPLNRQISLSSMRPFIDDDDTASGRRSPSQLTPIMERKNKDTILSFEDELFRRK